MLTRSATRLAAALWAIGPCAAICAPAWAEVPVMPTLSQPEGAAKPYGSTDPDVANLAKFGYVQEEVFISGKIAGGLPYTTRYAGLNVPNPTPGKLVFGHVQDIAAQAGLLLKSNLPHGPFKDMPVRHLVLGGCSEQGMFVRLYMRDSHAKFRMPDGKSIYDGYFPACVADWPPILGHEDGTPLANFTQPAVEVPTIMLATSEPEGFPQDGRRYRRPPQRELGGQERLRSNRRAVRGSTEQGTGPRDGALTIDWLYPALTATAAVAGFIDAIAGGGGLISVPALLYAGLPPTLALGTNKLQSACGTALAAWKYHRAGLFRLRPNLAAVGFVLEKVPGFGHKRDMLVGKFAGNEEAGGRLSQDKAALEFQGLCDNYCTTHP